MTKLLSLLCATLLLTAMLCGCAKRAAEDAADKVSSAASDIKEDAERYGKTDDDTDGNIKDDTAEPEPTMADMSEMIDNGRIDDENDDPTDGDNIDDDEGADDATDESVSDNDADGGDENAETMDDGSSFI